VTTCDNGYDLPIPVRELIAAKVQRLLRKGAVRVQDAEDVGQHLATHYLKRSARLDGRKAASLPYLSSMLDRCLFSLWRDQCAKKRKSRRTYCPPEEGITNDGFSSRRTCAGRSGIKASDQQELFELVADFTSVLDQLPAGLRRLATLLMTRSKSQAARVRGVTRMTQEREVRALRRCFKRAGLHYYL
jgi:hypothetical protein